jgi:hypothetical protein
VQSRLGIEGGESEDSPSGQGTMSDVLSRIQHLVALAASSSEEEARSAAVQACRLIREHKISLVLSEDAAATKETKEKAGTSSFFDDLGSFLDGIQNLAGSGSSSGPTRTYPFDPFTAPFRKVVEYARTHGVELEDRGSGRYSARFNGKLVVGTWPEIVRAVFSHIETPRGATKR